MCGVAPLGLTILNLNNAPTSRIQIVQGTLLKVMRAPSLALVSLGTYNAYILMMQARLRMAATLSAW